MVSRILRLATVAVLLRCLMIVLIRVDWLVSNISDYCLWNVVDLPLG